MITPEQAKHAQHKNLVTRALGIDPTVEPEIHEYETKPGDIYLLCSDGLCDMVERRGHRHDAAGARRRTSSSPRSSWCRWPMTTAGRDNVSVILVRVLREYPAAARRDGASFRLVKISSAGDRLWRN